MWYRIIRPRVDGAAWHRFPGTEPTPSGIWQYLQALDMLFFE